MYSANLTSLLARPAREQPIGTLPALEDAMRDLGYELVVESHSSSLAILEVSKLDCVVCQCWMLENRNTITLHYIV